MAARRVEGTALLVAGHGAIDGNFDASAIHTLGKIGETLLATGAVWQIRRLSAVAGERYPADRPTLKQHLDELVTQPVRAAMIVVVGVIDELATGSALITGRNHRDYPDDATLSLAWIRERLERARAEQLIVVVSGRGAGPERWRDALATGRPNHLIAAAASDTGAPMIDALLAGLRGDALDHRTGTVTMKSLGDHLAGRLATAALQRADTSQTLAQSPPLAGLWDVRRSQLTATRRRGPQPSGELDDLTGTVLPGRFRVDGMIARGAFGTVYRARQLAVERDIAIKVLHADIDPGSDDGRLFVHEIRSVGRIDHPNVVRIYQADIAQDGRLFYAMELLDGRDLQQLVPSPKLAGDGPAPALEVDVDSPVPQDRAVELVRQLLAGLGAAHDAGLVHADVKPANAIVIGERLVLVDFGLARLRNPDRPAESAGGTPAFMAPEQLADGRVDARSDLFSAALVLVALLTGWRRKTAQEIVPPLDGVADPKLRAVLARALAIDPAQRYPTARELAAALIGTALASTDVAPPPVLPFRLFAPLTEADRERLHGREADIAELIEHVLYRRTVIYTAPSGTGKTSLLRAGLVPRLEALGVAVAYVRCRNAPVGAIAQAIVPGASSVAEAITHHTAQRGGKLVIVLDQLEAVLADDAASERLEAELAFASWPAEADVALVLAIREDYLARLVARVQRLEPGTPVLRLRPLRPAGAREAIVAPIAEARLAIEPGLLETLLADLQGAAAALAPELGWGSEPAVYPPHLQLACSVLYEALDPDDTTLTLAHYRALGGFDAIVGEHLERVLDVELAGGRDAIARDVLIELVTTSHERAMRPEAELLDSVGGKHSVAEVADVLELLGARGLIVRIRGESSEPAWELVHDSLVPRVLAWLDSRDLARRRAIELVRYHVRRSRSDNPSLLGRRELRELRGHAVAIAEIDAQWRAQHDDRWSPATLVAHSRSVLRRRTGSIVGVVAAAFAVAGVGLYEVRAKEAEARAEQSLRDRDLGRFVIEVSAFDWDPHGLRALPVDAHELPELHWELRYPDPGDPDSPGAPFEPRHLEERVAVPGSSPTAVAERVEARGGPAFLVVTGRGRRGETCAPSIVPLHQLPGYMQRERIEPTLHVRIPTCAASHAGMTAIPAGPFIFHGRGEPPMNLDAFPELAVEQRVTLPAYAIDRTEVSNAAFRVFGDQVGVTGIATPQYPIGEPSLEHAGEPDRPAVATTWAESRAYCRFLGKQLPTEQQWQRALRGGERLPDGSPNPIPNRNLPWGTDVTPFPGNIVVGTTVVGSAAVGSHPGDRSPEGVLDLGGNVREWTDSQSTSQSFRIVMGGDWMYATTENYHDLVDVPSDSSASQRLFNIGFRCVAAVAR